jgi:hypothetical protein
VSRIRADTDTRSLRTGCVQAPAHDRKIIPAPRVVKELRPCFEAASLTVTPITDTSYCHMLAAISHPPRVSSTRPDQQKHDNHHTPG